MKLPTWTIEWNEGMSVGIPEIDEDHRNFIAMINGFNRSIIDRLSRQEIRNKFQAIIDDAERHFEQEERLFRAWRYPDLDHHVRSHEEALKSLRDVMKGFVPYGHDSEWVDAGLSIKDILMSHIMSEDMKYAAFYRNSAIA